MCVCCRNTQTQRLLQLSHSANACKKAIDDKLEFARRVISLSELSRAMETIQEQILPYAPVDIEYPSAEKLLGSPKPVNKAKMAVKEVLKESISKEDSATAAAAGDVDSVAGGTITSAQLRVAGANPPVHQASVWTSGAAGSVGPTAVMPADRLANFYRKYNKIMLDNIAIAKEKERLTLENSQLQDLISQYIAGTQLSDSVLADDNPLFVVNGRWVL